MFTPAIASPQNLRALLADLQSAPIPHHDRADTVGTRPFVTISRIRGVPAAELAHAVAARLNEADRDEPAWSVWDREVLEKVAQDMHLSQEVVESLEDSARSWLTDLFAGLPGHSAPPDQDAIFRNVAHTVHALAQVGRTIIVGSGGVLLTRRLGGGVHVCPVARREDRVRYIADAERIDAAEAARRIAELDENRANFFKRYWPKQSLLGEVFTLTVNLSEVPVDTAAEFIAKLVTDKRSQRG